MYSKQIKRQHSNKNKVPEKDTTSPCTASLKCAWQTFDTNPFIGLVTMTSSVVANDIQDVMDFPAISDVLLE